MSITVLRAKIHRATVTDASLDYEGSLGIDSALMEKVGLLHYEKILVGNITNGNRFETYVIPEPAGSRTIALNGAVCHLGKVGDLLVIMAFTAIPQEEARAWRPPTIVLADNNQRIQKEFNL